MHDPIYHQCDIPIGEDEWISYTEVEGRTDNATDVDPLMGPVEGFIRSLETDCLTACCGINAFSFWPEDIKKSAQRCTDPELVKKLTIYKNQIDELSSECVRSSILCQIFDRKVLLKILDHIITILQTDETTDGN